METTKNRGESQFTRNVQELVDACGSQAALGVALGVTQAAVSSWIVTGNGSSGAELQVAQTLLDLELRQEWFAEWAAARLWDLAQLQDASRPAAPATLEIEQWAEQDRGGRRRRRLVETERLEVSARAARAAGRQLARRWIGWSVMTMGDFLVAFRAQTDGSLAREVAFFVGAADRWDVRLSDGSAIIPSGRARQLAGKE